MNIVTTPRTLQLLGGFMLAGTLLFAACGGDDSDNDAATADAGATNASGSPVSGRTAAAQPTATPLPLDACKFITADEVTTALGASAMGAPASGLKDGAGCGWTAGDNKLSVSIRKGAEAQKDYDTARGQAAPVNGFAAEGSTEQLQAFRAESSGQSKWFVQRGDTFVTFELANATDLGRAITARSLASKLMARITI